MRIVPKELDRYGRAIGDVYRDDFWLNRELVKAGLAWHFKKYSDDERLAADEDMARELRVGLWSGSHGAIPPWEWRDMSKDERDKFR